MGRTVPEERAELQSLKCRSEENRNIGFAEGILYFGNSQKNSCPQSPVMLTLGGFPSQSPLSQTGCGRAHAVADAV